MLIICFNWMEKKWKEGKKNGRKDREKEKLVKARMEKHLFRKLILEVYF